MSENLTTNTNGVTFKPYGNLLSSTSPNLNQQIDSTSLSLGMMRMNSSNSANANQYLNKSNDMIDANRRLLMQQNGGSNINGTNNNQLQLFSSNGYQSQRNALSSSSNSSIQQSNDVHKENQEM